MNEARAGVDQITLLQERLDAGSDLSADQEDALRLRIYKLEHRRDGQPWTTPGRREGNHGGDHFPID